MGARNVSTCQTFIMVGHPPPPPIMTITSGVTCHIHNLAFTYNIIYLNNMTAAQCKFMYNYFSFQRNFVL